MAVRMHLGCVDTALTEFKMFVLSFIMLLVYHSNYLKRFQFFKKIYFIYLLNLGQDLTV